MKKLYSWLILIAFFVGADASATTCDQFLDNKYSHYSEFKDSMNRNTSYHIDRLPEISLSDIQNLKEVRPEDINGRGANFSSLMMGQIDGKDVFIKYCELAKPVAFGLNEASFSKLISDLEIGPHFYGVIKDNRGVPLAIVTRFVGGTTTKAFQAKGLFKTRSEEIQTLLTTLGIHAGDLQFRADYDNNLHIVDTGLYQIISPKHAPLLSFDEFSKALESIKKSSKYFQ